MRGAANKPNPPFRRMLLGFLAASVVLLGTIFIYADSKTSPGNSKISWTPSSLSVTISPGESNQYNLSFVASEDLHNAIFRVVPEIQPFVTVSPATINAHAGSAVTVTVKVVVSPETAQQTLSGTIQLRTDQPNKTIAVPLPINLKIAWATEQFNAPGAVIGFQYFADWAPSVNSSNSFDLISPSTQAAFAAGSAETPVDITMDIFDNSSGASLPDFIKTYEGGWYSIYSHQTTTTVAGYSAVVFNDSGAPVPHFPGLAAFVGFGSKVLVITGTFDAEPEFNAVLKSLTLN
jgi:hypothetical protein